MRGMWVVLGLLGCNHATGLPLPGDEATMVDSDGIFHPTPFPHVEPNGIQGNWIHVTPRNVTTMLWTFRPDGSFEMDVFEATHGRPFQKVPGTYRLQGDQLTLEGPFAGLPHVRMTEKLLFEGDRVAAPAFFAVSADRWQGIEHIDEIDGSGLVTKSYDQTDSYQFVANGQVDVSVSTEGNLLSDLTGPSGFAAIADVQEIAPGEWDLSLGSIPSWNQLAEFGGGMAAPPMTRTF